MPSQPLYLFLNPTPMDLEFLGFAGGVVLTRGRGGQGLALIFIPAGGGDPSPLDPLPPSPGPPPPLPPQLKCTRKPGFWEHFLVMGNIFRRLRHMPYTVYILLHVCSISLVFQTIMP